MKITVPLFVGAPFGFSALRNRSVRDGAGVLPPQNPFRFLPGFASVTKATLLSSLPKFSCFVAVAMAVETSTIANAQSFDAGLIGYYQFEGNANDSSGNGNNGTASGITYVPDRFGNPSSAASFAGNSSSYVEFPTAAFDLSTPFTITAWINFTAGQGSGNPRIFSTAGYEICTTGTSSERLIDMNVNDASEDVQTVTSTTAVSAGTWTQVVGVWNGDEMSLYIDGALSASAPTTLVPSYSRGFNPAIGVNSGLYSNDDYAGLVDDVRVYDLALSGSEVQQLYSAEAVPEPSSAVLALLCVPVLCRLRRLKRIGSK